jgi:hypothetical protein
VVALVIAVLGAGGSHFAMRAADVSAAGAKMPLVHLSHPPEYIRKAHVWMPIPPGTAAAEVSQRDAYNGPKLALSWRPGEKVTCSYLPQKEKASSNKFHCRLADGTKLKVKYAGAPGRKDGMDQLVDEEVFSEAMTS